MKSIRHLMLATAMCAVSSSAVWAQAPSVIQQPVISKKWHLQYDIGADGRSTQTFDSRNQIGQANAIEGMKTYTFTYSSSIQSAEVLEAYTEKPDGRRITVPPNNYQTTTNKGRGDASPFFSDRTSISVVFPDLAVGDIVGIAYKIADKEPIFPGHFSVAQTFSAYSVYEDGQFTVHAPANLKLHIESHQLQDATDTVDGDTRTLQWHYRNPKPLEWDERDNGIWRLDESPSVIVSTFGSYEEIAAAYGARALPKAQPDTRIRDLAASIVGNETAPRERARLLYEWVSRNITYGGNCIGVGTVVPRDTAVVLENRMGDCKDHATLLQALLAASDIPSEQVLINAGSLYDLTLTPVVSLVNHVINYIPAFNLYLDATAKDIPFGYLPFGGYGKPVIHVGTAKALSKTPDQQHEQSVQRIAMKLELAKDGSATGEMQLTLHGLYAASTRAYVRDLNQEGEKDFVKWALASFGYKGKGTLAKGDTTGISDAYSMHINFEITNFLSGGSSGAFILGPVISTPIPVMAFAEIRDRIEPARRHICSGFHSFESIDLTVAPGIKLTSLPSPLKVRSRLLDYDAKYQRTKAGLLVTREVHDKTPTSICGADTAAELHKQALPVADNLKTQVLYQRPTK